MTNLPKWAAEDVRLRHDGEPTSSEWEQNDETRFSRVIHIAYPNGVYYVVDKLEPGHPHADEHGWREIPGEHFVPETAMSTAQKKSYYEQVPYRVREVVWDG